MPPEPACVSERYDGRLAVPQRVFIRVTDEGEDFGQDIGYETADGSTSPDGACADAFEVASFVLELILLLREQVQKPG